MERIRFDRNVLDFFRTSRWRDLRERAGRLALCQGCANLCHILPSLYYSLDVGFALGAASDLRYLKERRRVRRARRRSYV